jgi:hypothetical protein
MAKQLMLLTFVGALLVALWALPVHAGMMAVSDSDLAAITGKDNAATVNGDGNILQGGDDQNGDVVVGILQWDDTHTGDLSNHKGANDQGGSSSQVQNNVTASINAISWGALASANYVSAGAVADAGVDQEAWATLYVGGF